MWPYHPELLARPVPRYTSFPTAAEFTERVGAEALGEALDATEGDVSLYVHIPFCEAICWYCGCNTAAAGHRQRLAAYLEALTREIALVGAWLRPGVRVRRVAFGGGSPNALSPVDFVRLVTAITRHFPLAAPVWSVELDPRGLDAEWAAALGHVGITRASLGVQTFAPHLQHAIGRVQHAGLIAEATALLRWAGVTSLNFDLMYGLPGQSAEDLIDALTRSITLGADRIALFGYAHVPQLLPRQRRIDARALPGRAERFAMAALGHRLLSEAGYTPVGFDHFARPGDALAQAVVTGRLRRNFQGFTEDAAPVTIGLGASAISSFPDRLAQNEKNAGRYRMLLSQDRLAAARGVWRHADDRARERTVMGLLCQGHVALERAGLASVEAGLRPFLARGLAALSGRELAVLPAGLPYARSIAALFDPYRREGSGRFSSAV